MSVSQTRQKFFTLLYIMPCFKDMMYRIVHAVYRIGIVSYRIVLYRIVSYRFVTVLYIIFAGPH